LPLPSWWVKWICSGRVLKTAIDFNISKMIRRKWFPIKNGLTVVLFEGLSTALWRPALVILRHSVSYIRFTRIKWQYEGTSKTFRTDAAIYTAVVVARCTGRL
jgi:hypothetical protein